MLRQAEELDWMEDLYHAVRELKDRGVTDRQIKGVVNKALVGGTGRLPLGLKERVEPGHDGA